MIYQKGDTLPFSDEENRHWVKLTSDTHAIYELNGTDLSVEVEQNGWESGVIKTRACDPCDPMPTVLLLERDANRYMVELDHADRLYQED